MKDGPVNGSLRSHRDPVGFSVAGGSLRYASSPHWRMLHGKNQTQVATELGVSPAAVSQWVKATRLGGKAALEAKPIADSRASDPRHRQARRSPQRGHTKTGELATFIPADVPHLGRKVASRLRNTRNDQPLLRSFRPRLA